MTYSVIQPPFSLRFRTMSRGELEAYYRWFQEIIPKRIEILERFVKDSDAPTWEADCSPTSLEELGSWFATQLETRPRTELETQEILREAPYPIDVPNYELTNRSFSLVVDIGMYFAMTLRQQFPEVHWQLPLDNKRFADYGQPVLVGLGVVPLNPVRIAVTLAYGIASKKKTGRGLREAYDYWATASSRQDRRV